MEQNILLNLYENATRARKLELELFDLYEKKEDLQKELEKLGQAAKPKRRFFRFSKKEQDDYEISQAKKRYDIAVRELSYIQDLTDAKLNELSGLQKTKELFSEMYEKKLAAVRLSGKHKEKFQILEVAYLTSLKRKELLPEAKEKAWQLQYKMQDIILILRQAVEAYNADVNNGISQFNKFERIDKANAETEKLEQMLKDFQNILNEMDLKFAMQIDTKNFVSYAQEGNESFWTDSRILTLQVRKQVKEILEEFEEKEIHADNFRKELNLMEKNIRNELYENQNRLEEFVVLYT